MPTEAYHLPDFLALLPKVAGSEINPHFKEVESEFNALMELVFGNHRALVAEASECDSALFAASIFPLASHQQLRAITNYTVAAFLFDDLLQVSFHLLFDTILGKLCSESSRVEDLEALKQSWMKALTGGDDEVMIAQHPIIETVRSQLLQGIKTALCSFHWPQFIETDKKMLATLVQELYEREVYWNKHTTLDIQSYMMQRRFSIGTGQYFLFVQCTRGLYIPNSILSSPVIHEMENAIADMLIIPHDIYSFKKEYSSADGPFSNILKVIENDPHTAHLSFQGRLDYVEKFFKAALERFHRCRQQLPSYGPEMDEFLVQYADGLIGLVSGNLRWSRMVRRYNKLSSDEDRKENIVRLTLDGPPTLGNEIGVPVY